jgi:hypothetical protein
MTRFNEPIEPMTLGNMVDVHDHLVPALQTPHRDRTPFWRMLARSSAARGRLSVELAAHGSNRDDRGDCPPIGTLIALSKIVTNDCDRAACPSKNFTSDIASSYRYW